MDSIGPYQLLEELARGGMGVVYRARGPQGLAAVKVLLDGQHDPRFERELEAQRGLVHPGIVRVFDGGRDPRGRSYLVMELVEGGSLADRLRREGALPWAIVQPLALQLCEAVSFAHEQGVLHRDLKPDNVLLDAKGQAKLTDFGLAKIVDQRESLTRTGTVMGTPAYMPPEQASGEKHLIGPRSDVYGLGATIYALVCGCPPIQAESLHGLIVGVLRNPPTPPSKLCPEIHPRLEQILLCCLAKAPDDRFASVAALRDELVALQPVRARQLPAVALALAIVAVGGGAAALVLASAGRGPESAQVSPAPTPEESPTPTAEDGPASAPPSSGLDTASRELAESTLSRLQDVQDRVLSGEVVHGSEEETLVLDEAWSASQRAPDLGPWLTVKAHLDLRADDYELAAERLEQATAQEPERAYAWTKLGQALTLVAPGAVAAELEAAREALERALSIDPDQALALMVLAQIEWRAAPEAALAHLGRALELEPRWWPLYRLRSEIRYAQADGGGALADIQRALEIAPGRPDLLCERGFTLLAAGDVEGAQADLLQAETLGPSVETLLLRGRLAKYQGADQEALDCLDQVLSLDPTSPRARINRAGVAGEQNPAQGVLDMQAVLDDPSVRGEWQVKGRLQLAGLLAGLGRHEEALAELLRAEAIPEAEVQRALIEAFRARIEASRQ